MFRTYLLCEAIYYLYSKHVTYKQLENTHYSELKAVVPYVSSFELYKHILCYLTNEHDIDTLFSEVFIDKQSITINNIKKLLSYCIFNIDPTTNNMRLWQSIYINSIIKKIKPRLSILNNNTNTTCKSSMIMTNKLDIVHKPFAFYTLMYAIRKVFNYYMYTLGFTNIIEPITNLRVWIKYNNSATNDIPLVFIHGIGFGIIPYISKIRKLSVDRKMLIVPELPNLSYDLYKFPPPSNESIVVSLYNTLVKLGIKLIDIIGHSNGSILMNIFQIRYPHMCNYKTYAEPVCFHIHQAIGANMFYRFPLTTKYSIKKYILWLFVFRDMYTQYAIKRGVFAEHGLLKNLDNKTHIILAKNDCVVPSFHIHKYITAHHPDVNVTVVEGNHGVWLSS